MEDEKIIPEMVTPTSVCIHPEIWHAYDNMATEIEVLQCLRSLIYMLKPHTIIETGCYHGHATEQLALGAVDNGFGSIHTCDVGADACAITAKRIRDIPCPQISVTQCDGISLIGILQPPIEFAFLDSGPDEIRTNELRALYPKLAPGGVVAIHDTGIHGYLREKYLPPLLRELEMQFIMFDTPRGLTLCRKRPEVYP